MTTGQPPALTTPHIFSTECFKHTSSTYSAKRIVGAAGCLAVVASGGALAAQARCVLGLIPIDCQLFTFLYLHLINSKLSLSRQDITSENLLIDT